MNSSWLNNFVSIVKLVLMRFRFFKVTSIEAAIELFSDGIVFRIERAKSLPLTRDAAFKDLKSTRRLQDMHNMYMTCLNFILQSKFF